MSTVVKEPSWLREVREEAALRFAEKGFPDRRREEEWRWTDLTPLKQAALRVAEAPGELSDEALAPLSLPGGHLLVFVDGFLSLKELPEEVELEPLSPSLFGRVVDVDHGFLLFNTANFQSGHLLRVWGRPSSPLQLLFLQTRPAAALPRLLLVLEEGAQLTLLEQYESRCEGLTDAVLEVVLKEGAQLELVKLQREQEARIHFGGLYLRQERRSRFRHFHLADGSRIARSEVHVHLCGEEARAELTGIHLATGRRHLDSHTWIWHAAPRCLSRDRYKSIAADRGRSVFQGRIVVEEGATGSDGHMEHRGLLLSEEAEIDAKPQLEIYCDEVRCDHGVAIGQFDPEALFYLRSRGIPKRQAEAILLEGFVAELLEEAPETIRPLLEQAFRERLGEIVGKL